MNQEVIPGAEQLQMIQNDLDKIDNDFFESVQYSLFTEDDFATLSSFDITLIDIRNNYQSKFRTGMDAIDKNPILGVSDPKQICPTCNKNGRDCPGHFSTIELPFYLPNPNYLREISYILNCFCINCSSLKLSNYEKFEMRRISKNKRLEYMSSKLSSKVFCDNCKPLFTDFPIRSFFFKPSKIGTIVCLITAFKYDNKCFLNFERVFYNFSKIKDEDSKFIGLGENKPKDLIMKKILVIPPINRPQLQDGTKLYIDGITKSYSAILMTIANFLQKNLIGTELSDCSSWISQNYEPAIETDISDILDLFEKYEFTMEKVPVINSIQNLYNSVNPKKLQEQSKSSLDTVSFRNKLDGKYGLLRRFMMGKRVNQTARTVVGPSPDFDIDELGVPKFIAQNLSVRANVTSFNLNMILDLQKSNKIKSIIRIKNGQEKRLTQSADKPIAIKIGDIVERELMDGDYVLANRNPTIQKQGTMGLRARIIDENIFRLNLALTPPFNADFDGDELNIHVPQTLQSMAELSTIASAEGCYGNQQQSNLMVGLVFDAVTGSFILSQDFIYIPPDDFHQCVYNANMPDDFINNTKKYDYGATFIKTKAKYTKCIEIVFNYLYIYVKKFSEDIIKNIYDNLNDFENKINNINYSSFEDDFNENFQRPFNNKFMLDQLIEIYFKNSNDNFYKNIINVFLQKEFLEKQVLLNIDLEKNDTQYLYLFLDKIAFYCALRESLIEEDDSSDTQDHYFDQCLKNNVDIYSGKSLFSTILPIMNYEKVKKGKNPFDNFVQTVKIKKGILYQGWLNKEHVGGNTNSIPHILFLYQDQKVVSFFLTYAQRLINHYFLTEGFTLGVHDCMLNEDIQEDLADKISIIRNSASLLEKNIQSYDENEKEEKIIQNLQEIRLLNDVVIKSLNVRSPLLIMAELAKAKGKGANLVQIMAAIGQQYYGGKRIKNDTPYFEENDPDPMARGLCLNSFMQGLTPSEFIYHMYSSREGLVEGAIKTGDCGAMHHNIAKVLEVLIVKEDRSIRNIQGRIIQYMYGEDGFDSEQLQKIKVDEYTYTSFIDVEYIASIYNSTIQ